jgi:molybdate transport system substrate-binding protein
MRRRTLVALGAGLPAAVALLPWPTHGMRPAAPGESLTVFAAASLQPAMEAIARLYARQGGGAVRFSFAASGTLARQIEQGAPAGVYASADEAWMDWLQQRGLIVPESRRSLLGNRLVLVVPVASAVRTVDLVPGFDLDALLGTGGRWVTGDPASVPVGRYAQAALERLGAWPAAARRLVRTESVRVALGFVERGEVGAAVVYGTDALGSNRVRVVGTFPADSHPPIRYPFAAIARQDTPAARAFLRFCESPAAIAVWKQYGFLVRE